MTNPNTPEPEQVEDLIEEAEAVAAEAADAEAEAEVDADAAPETDEGEQDDVEKQLAERTEDLQRVSAEYANYRRRTERERAAIAEHAKAAFATELLPLLDDLDLAEQHGDLNEGPLKAFADKLRGVVTAQRVQAFGAEGDTFDPETHEAVQDLSSGDDKVIGTVLRKGYRVGDRLVRNAMVIIADPAEEPAEDNE
ncbi:nucleotide exchange factor GrpE [Corynebacterium sp. NML130628]|uniref:nucleotide exchange factor GrpE n=1 Tax=Corynebacterium sp. NML130628 TaxID=1906333 RepID=UPI0008FB1978|nr:nucleotide exchange factor GrpE [Corynebacterium sp. NML130628]